MSARDDAMKVLEQFVRPEEYRIDLLDALLATGSIILRDQLEQVGWYQPVHRDFLWHVLPEHAAEHGWQPVFILREHTGEPKP